MRGRPGVPACVLVVACLATSAVWGDEKAAPPAKTQTVTRGPLKVEVTLSGVFESAVLHEVLLRPDVWSTLKVAEVVAEGTRVTAGQPILKLITKDLDTEIREQEFALQLSELAVRQARVELESLERSVPLDLDAARRARRVAEEELDYFVRITEAQRKESARESLKSAEYSLEYAREELDQLQQMYKADDLTEQTEEIILKRAQRAVERSDYFLEVAKTSHDRSLDIEIPRERQRLEETAARQNIALRKAEATLPPVLEKQRIEVQKVEHAHDQLVEKLKQLRADREQMTLTAPTNGLVYYGQSDRGKWSTAAALRKQLRPGGTVSANTVLLTVVEDRELFVRVDVPEKEFRHFQPGTPASVRPTAYPKARFAGECVPTGLVPVTEGTFDGRVNITRAEGDPVPVIGMTCQVLIMPYQNDAALTVPATAIFGDEDDRHVYLEAGGEATKRSVTTGETAGGQTEIVDGLTDGDIILLEKP